MKPMPTWAVWICRLALIVLMPVVLTVTNVRLLLTPLFPAIEYNLPGFPDDVYGLTKAERLEWSNVAITYLVNEAGIEFLGQLRFPEGRTAPLESCGYYVPPRDCTYLYNDRELKHMVDVKAVTRWALSVWLGSTLLALLALVILSRAGEKAALRAGVLGGAGVTLALWLGVLLYLVINFDSLFVLFHQIFFEGGTWMFLWSDTLIRLFPERFWQDTFIFIGGASIVEAAGLTAWAWFKK